MKNAFQLANKKSKKQLDYLKQIYSDNAKSAKGKGFGGRSHTYPKNLWKRLNQLIKKAK